MNIFEIFKTKSNYNNIDLAYQLFNTLGVGGSIDSKYKNEIKRIQKECTDVNISPYPDRQKVLLKVIELAGEPSSSMQRYLLAIAYAWSRANYREQAIYYIELYIDNGLCDEICSLYSKNNNIEEGRKKHSIEMHHFLFKNYIGLYNFEKALKISEKMISIDPINPIGYFDKVESLTKQNKLQECKSWLNNVKHSSYYKKYTYIDALGKKYQDDWFYSSINKLLKETNDKIKNGYIYKPRNKKDNVI